MTYDAWTPAKMTKRPTSSSVTRTTCGQPRLPYTSGKRARRRKKRNIVAHLNYGCHLAATAVSVGGALKLHRERAKHLIRFWMKAGVRVLRRRGRGRCCRQAWWRYDAGVAAAGIVSRRMLLAGPLARYKGGEVGQAALSRSANVREDSIGIDLRRVVVVAARRGRDVMSRYKPGQALVGRYLDVCLAEREGSKDKGEKDAAGYLQEKKRRRLKLGVVSIFLLRLHALTVAWARKYQEEASWSQHNTHRPLFVMHMLLQPLAVTGSVRLIKSPPRRRHDPLQRPKRHEAAQ